jgi:hypothetical protein
MQGLWLASNPEHNRLEEETVVGLVKRYPGAIAAVVVGNEVLLRGEMSAQNLAATIGRVKAEVGAVPVTYADVWEFWLRNRELLPTVDFVTIHILPYWEDFPIPAAQAAAHVEEIRARAAQAFPDKEILIGETGWPSRGRMREGALPSPSNQARVMHEILALAKRKEYRVNLIEAYDQPWKRSFEGTVGGYWGLFDAYRREPKFAWGEPVSDHPFWRWQAGGGAAFAALVFGVAYWARRRRKRAEIDWRAWIGIAIGALTGGALVGWAVENAYFESLGAGGALRSATLVLVALAAAPLAAAGLGAGVTLPGFASVLGRAGGRPRDPIVFLIGAALVLLVVLAVQTALGLVFDPRYRDFPFAALGAATAPLLMLSILSPRPIGTRGRAERLAAAVLGLSAVYIALDEGFANWQAMWLCAVLAGIGFILLRLRDAPGSG